MIPASFPVPIDTAQPAPCSKPEHLSLVDAAFERPGGPAAEQMKRELCARCPIGNACLTWAMGQHEYGVWGGTSPNARTRHGAPNSNTTPESAGPRQHTPYRPTIAADIPVAVLRAWALEHGLPVHPFKGQISKAVREQYVAAHQLAAS